MGRVRRLRRPERRPAAGSDQTGTFDGPATVALDLRCGSVDLATEAGAGWHVQAGYAAAAPAIGASSTRLSLRAPEESNVRQEWTVTVAPDRLSDLEVRVNGATGTARLDGATLTRVSVDANAGDVLVGAAGATVSRLDVTANAGRIRVTLGPGPTVGDLKLNASAMDLCVPAESGLRITANEQLTFATNLSDRGLAKTGSVWERPATGTGALIDLSVSGNAAAFNLDPSGGCG